MAFLRVAVFTVEGASDATLTTWEDIMGSALRNHPDCIEVTASRSGDEVAIISKWQSEEAFRAATQSKPIVDVHITVSNRLGMSPDQEPTWSFEGSI
ncbi:MAG: hypothetical protein HKN74_14955 [Acidimicrobiia bacterium]|nr:antibiotic biosynthesis monooxygenase [Acidimicrobiia bacterium]MBT8216069.1 antibiotic biosynthesis monooxygenase [Acidimicrobiia bacterium]NNF11573.1 hypothetical protein [Acidimicrobiia bacterium]NNL70454.1 hypothetical protein [Acidimicrobiia bacterium]